MFKTWHVKVLIVTAWGLVHWDETWERASSAESAILKAIATCTAGGEEWLEVAMA